MDAEDEVKRPTARKYRISHHLPEEEVIEVSFSLTSASQMYIVINNGLATIQHHLNQMEGIKTTYQQDPVKYVKELKDVTLQMNLATQAFKEGATFLKEISEIIKELDEKPKSKIIIPPPNFKVDK